jgi:2-aminomuconate deaminase
MFTEPILANDDRIHSLKDDEWNRKILEFLGQGRLEDVAQLSRQIHTQVRVQKVVSFKPMWFLSGVNGQNNNLIGEVLAYEALHGAGGAVVHLLPDPNRAGDKEYDEDDVEYYSGDRDVLDRDGLAQVIEQENPESEDHGFGQSSAGEDVGAGNEGTGTINTDSAPKPVGAYPHARKVGDLLYLSGVGPRQAGSDEIPGGATKNGSGQTQDYDIEAQTRACIENVKTILDAAGSSLDKVQDITVFLIDMERDFAGYNEVYGEYFSAIGATRTTLAITALPTPIAVEMKVIALA